MSGLLEIFLFGILAYGVGGLIRRMVRRRGEKRYAAIQESVSVEIPCRLSWLEATGHRRFIYGKIITHPGGEVGFRSRRGYLINLPRSEWVHKEASWRAGLVAVWYSVPGAGKPRILLSEPDAAIVESLLRSLQSDK